MSRLPKISIIIPVYNVEQYIADCIRSVIRQTYSGEVECVVVDDCGTDQSLSIADSLISKYKGSISFKIIHHERNRGLSAARNTGISIATGEYLFFLDSDDFISDNCIDQLTSSIQNCNYDVIVGDFKKIGNGQSDAPRLLVSESQMSSIDARQALLSRRIYVMAWNKLIKKDFLTMHNMRFEEGYLHEDEIFTFNMAMCNPTIYIMDSITYFYRVRPNSIMLNEHKSFAKAQAYQKVVLKITSDSYFDISDSLCWDYVSLLIPNTFVGRLKHPILFWKYYKMLRHQLSQQSSLSCTPGSASNLRKSIAMHWRLSVFGGYCWLMAREIKNQLFS